MTNKFFRLSFGNILVVSRHIDDIPGGPDAEELRHKTSMHDVAAAFCHNLSKDWHAEECEVSDDVEYLVTYKLVTESQLRFVKHTIRSQHDCIVQRASPDQVCFSQRFNLVAKSKGSSCSNVTTKRTVAQFH